VKLRVQPEKKSPIAKGTQMTETRAIRLFRWRRTRGLKKRKILGEVARETPTRRPYSIRQHGGRRAWKSESEHEPKKKGKKKQELPQQAEIGRNTRG